MKFFKIGLVLIGLIYLTNTVNAIDLSGLKIGLKAAPQITWGTADNKNTSSNGMRLNVGYGLMVDYYFTNNYALATEICINSYGVNHNIKKERFDHVTYGGVSYANTDDVKIDYRLQYMQIPVLLRMRTNEVNRSSYYAEFGFGLGFLTRARADISFSDKSLTDVKVNDPDVSDDYVVYYNAGSSTSPNMKAYNDDAFEFRSSLIIGGGLHYSLKGSSILVAGLRYDNAFSSYTADDKWFTKLNYVALNLGIIF